MKDNVDIYVALATLEDVEDYHDEAEEALDKLNTILHLLYDKADEEIETERLEKMINYTWETWLRDPHLVALDEDEMLDWVDQTLASWDDAQY